MIFSELSIRDAAPQWSILCTLWFDCTQVIDVFAEQNDC